MYRERTWAPPWVLALLWTACLAAAVATAGDLLGSEPTYAGIAILGLTLVFPALVALLFARLDVEVRADHVHIAFGPVQLFRKRIVVTHIESVRSLTYRPIRDFGGWGIRPRGSRTAWTIRGNRAVKVTLRSGKQVYVGSRYPQRLEERIRSAMKRMDVKSRSDTQ